MKFYDGLRDNNLQGFFCSGDKKKHLQKMGLITRNGYIINKPDEYLRKKELYKKLLEDERGEKKKKAQSKKLTNKVKNPYKENA